MDKKSITKSSYKTERSKMKLRQPRKSQIVNMETIKELFKSHYNCREAAEVLAIEYNTAAVYYRGFKATGITRHQRTKLMPEAIVFKLQETVYGIN